MDKKLSGVLDELLDYAPKRDTDSFIESRAEQVIASAVYLIRMIKENYDPETADDLSKRLLRSIAANDPKKFSRKMWFIKESRGRKNDN